ncbi:hypothetical protein ES705_19250 [subsurface metagenome]
MKSITNMLLRCSLLAIICSAIAFGDTIEEEVLVLFKAGTITMPAGMTTATLGQVTGQMGSNLYFEHRLLIYTSPFIYFYGINNIEVLYVQSRDLTPLSSQSDEIDSLNLALSCGIVLHHLYCQVK